MVAQTLMTQFMMRKTMMIPLNGNSAPMKPSPRIRNTNSVHIHTDDKFYAYSLDTSANIHFSPPNLGFIKLELRSGNNVLKKCIIFAKGRDLVRFGPTCGHHGIHPKCGNSGHAPPMIRSYLGSKLQ